MGRELSLGWALLVKASALGGTTLLLWLLEGSALPVPLANSLEFLKVLAETARVGGMKRGRLETLCSHAASPNWTNKNHLRCFGLEWTVLMIAGIGCSMLWMQGQSVRT